MGSMSSEERMQESMGSEDTQGKQDEERGGAPGLMYPAAWDEMPEQIEGDKEGERERESMESVAAEERVQESMGSEDTRGKQDEERGGAPGWDKEGERERESMKSVASEECMESVPPPWKQPRAATGPAKLGDWICKKCGNLNFNRRGFCAGRRGKCGQSRASSWKPGDWYCSCGNHNMAFRTHCNRTWCGLPREQGEQR